MAEVEVARTSRIAQLYKLDPIKRAKKVGEFAGLALEEMKELRSSLTIEQADHMIENVVGMVPIPLGIATNFRINGKDYLIPMATIEASVVAAASNGAKMARAKGGFTTTGTDSIMVGQIQLVNVKDTRQAEQAILKARNEILKIANRQRRTIQARNLTSRTVKTSRGLMVLAELQVDCKNAMGSNSVDDMAEAVAPFIEKVTGGKALLRIVSNYAIERVVKAKAIVAKEAVGGSEVVEGILDAYALADADIRRAATHNKGIMNGVTAVALATCNETQAIEATAHAYAARSGRYRPLTVWKKNTHGDLVGTIELPMPVGIVGGAISSHPTAKVVLKILGVKSASELGEIMAAVGIAQNLAALRALVAEGIQRGHMGLHARNIAVMAGAKGELVDRIAEQIVREKRIRLERAEQLLAEYKKELIV